MQDAISSTVAISPAPRATKREIHFPGLNGLRFLGAYAVVIHHVEQYKQLLGMENIWGSSIVRSLGPQSVYLFFTLSSFLITFLLLKEQEQNGRISIRNFMLRRAVRILPLYYFIVLVAFFVMPFIAP